MKLCYWKHTSRVPNFGDVLNPYIFNKILPGTFDEDFESIFVGIGTLLEIGMGEKLNIPSEYLDIDEPKSRSIIIFGSGAGYSKPPILDTRWKFYCVRGPLTADLLGLDKKIAVVDPAILIRRLYASKDTKRHKVSLMPHHSSSSEVLKTICEETGINYIDPLDTVENILDQISESEKLLTEALHGAIVADALRTPWVPIRTNSKIFSFKWQDWCKSINTEYAPLTTSDILGKIWKIDEKPSLFVLAKQRIKLGLAERNLKKIAINAKPIMSSDRTIEDLTQELEHRIEMFKRDVANGLFP